MHTVELNRLSGRIIGAAMEVHRELGAGLAEDDYELALSSELAPIGIFHMRQDPLPVIYKGFAIDCEYRLDLLVEDVVIVELKSVAALHPIHEAQLLTYLRLAKKQLGLLLNFDVPILKDGIRRRVLGLEEDGYVAEPVRKNIPTTIALGSQPFDDLSNQLLSAAIEVHRHLGCGLLKSAYEGCLAYELSLRGLPVERKKPMSVRYRDTILPKPVEVDMIVAEQLPLMFASVTDISTLLEARLLGQLNAGNWPFGLLLNFNGKTLHEGVRRLVNPRFGRRK